MIENDVWLWQSWGWILSFFLGNNIAILCGWRLQEYGKVGMYIVACINFQLNIHSIFIYGHCLTYSQSNHDWQRWRKKKRQFFHSLYWDNSSVFSIEGRIVNFRVFCGKINVQLLCDSCCWVSSMAIHIARGQCGLKSKPACEITYQYLMACDFIQLNPNDVLHYYFFFSSLFILPKIDE